MDNHSNSTTNAIGFCLLPSDLIQNILLCLALPEIMGMKLVNKSIAYLISDQNFVHQINLRSKSASWLFLYKKRWCRNAVLEGFSNQSTRWFKIAVADLLKPLISPAEDLYFLAASRNIFLFVSNTKRQVIAVNLVNKTVKKIPASPLGPRGTSSWRRSGMKLVAECDRFRFLFAELVEDRPVLFEYNSETDTWRSMEARENTGDEIGDCIFLNAVNRPNGSVVVAVDSQRKAPVILRPRLDAVGGNNGQQVAVGFSNWENITDQLYVYGDGHMMIVRSRGVEDSDARVRMLSGIEVWGLSQNGENWEYICRVPSDIIRKISKAYGVMMGCLEKADGEIKVVLMSNYECIWEIIWLSYDIETNCWTWIPLPDCNMKGLNMAGIAFSRGLTLS
ncbi:hypothetical protein ACOSQ2_015711 [Xanthoceras sorbifolium]|uniref:F-box domain-containing protein n=1 Tax=Xanthoceras sorbifolium TaxID=99658 RepID=A0ABQ8I6U3_9ROSI|nr:hypothetical protein JRO89_XS04G0240900 [Xanthoceras sorbifolium]